MVALDELVIRDPGIMGGTPCFAGTRVPFRTLLVYLRKGHSIDLFLDHFPSVSREQAVETLNLAEDLILAKVR